MKKFFEILWMCIFTSIAYAGVYFMGLMSLEFMKMTYVDNSTFAILLCSGYFGCFTVGYLVGHKTIKKEVTTNEQQSTNDNPR